ncbi:MAG: 3-5 exonuclease [Verrucomicrobiales bacterium]|nr:3-5 exonuclease [Verrucomicrobiales bacterium]
MIETDEQLSEFLARLRDAAWVAIDTEADSLHAYPEKLCLIQISIEGADVLIDPLAKLDLAPLWPVLHKHELIFHGADYDLRLLRKNKNFVPTRIFDTMIAARLLGETEFGLTNLVKNFLDVTLDKGPQKADWAKRPLTERMANYARNDTLYLKSLSDILRAKLREAGRLAWVEQSCAQLIVDCGAPPPPDEEPWRIKGSARFPPISLAVLREIWLWREKEAIAGNKPPYFVLSHEIVLSLAEAAGTSRSFAEMIPHHLSPRRKHDLEMALARGMAVAIQEQPKIFRSFSRRPTEVENRRFDQLKKTRDHIATTLKLDPSLIAPKAMLAMLAQDWAKHENQMMPWQRELLLQHKQSQP